MPSKVEVQRRPGRREEYATTVRSCMTKFILGLQRMVRRERAPPVETILSADDITNIHLSLQLGMM
jgi:hypothetical protein